MSRLTSHSCLPPPTAPPCRRPSSGGTSSLSQWPAWRPTRRGPGGSYSGAGASGVRKERKKSGERAEPGAGSGSGRAVSSQGAFLPGGCAKTSLPSDGKAAAVRGNEGRGILGRGRCGGGGRRRSAVGAGVGIGRLLGGRGLGRWLASARPQLAALGAWRARHCTRPQAPAAARRQITTSVPSWERLSRMRPCPSTYVVVIARSASTSRQPRNVAKTHFSGESKVPAVDLPGKRVA